MVSTVQSLKYDQVDLYTFRYRERSTVDLEFVVDVAVYIECAFVVVEVQEAEAGRGRVWGGPGGRTSASSWVDEEFGFERVGLHSVRSGPEQDVDVELASQGEQGERIALWECCGAADLELAQLEDLCGGACSVSGVVRSAYERGVRRDALHELEKLRGSARVAKHRHVRDPARDAQKALELHRQVHCPVRDVCVRKDQQQHIRFGERVAPSACVL